MALVGFQAINFFKTLKDGYHPDFMRTRPNVVVKEAMSDGLQEFF